MAVVVKTYTAASSLISRCFLALARLLALTASGRGLAERVEAASRDRFAQMLAALPSDNARDGVVAALEALNTAISTI